MLVALVLWQRGGWPGRARGGGWRGVLGLSVYLIGFSLAYRGLDAGTGALVLFGMVQVTMFAGALVRVRRFRCGAGPGPDWRWAGLVLIAAPGAAGCRWGRWR